MIGISWYPVTTEMTTRDPNRVRTFFDSVATLGKGRPIYFYQFGCPSGKLVKCLESLQAQFVRQAFSAWDAHKA